MKTCPNCGNMNADDAKFCEGCGTAFEEKIEEKEVVPQVDGEIVSEGKNFSGDAYSGSGIDAGNGDNINASGFGTATDNGSAPDNGVSPDNGASPENGASQFGDLGQNSQPNGYGPQESVGQDFSGQPGYGGQNYQGQQGYPQQNVAPQNYPGQGYGGPGYGQQGNYQQGYNQQGNYQQGYGPAPKKDLTTVCTLALVFGIIGFFCDPFYIITTAAFILGIIGLANNGSKKGQAMAGFICSICATCVQVIFDICTLGIGVFF